MNFSMSRIRLPDEASLSGNECIYFTRHLCTFGEVTVETPSNNNGNSSGGVLVLPAAQIDHRNLGAIVNFEALNGTRVIGLLECITMTKDGAITFTVASADYPVHPSQQIELSLPRHVISLMNISRYVNDLKDSNR